MQPAQVDVQTVCENPLLSRFERFIAADLQPARVDHQIVRSARDVVITDEDQPHAGLVRLRQNVVRLFEPVARVPVRRCDGDLLVRIHGVDQLHQRLRLRNVPVVEVVFCAGIAARERVVVDELERMAQDHHHEHRENLRADRADSEPFPLALQQVDQRLEAVHRKQQQNAVEEVEVPPAVIEDRASDHRESEERPNEREHHEVILLFARKQLFCFAAKRVDERGEVAEQHQREHEQRGSDCDHHGDVVPRNRTRGETHIEHIARPVRKVGRARIDIRHKLERIGPKPGRQREVKAYERHNREKTKQECLDTPLSLDKQCDQIQYAAQSEESKAGDAHIRSQRAKEREQERCAYGLLLDEQDRKPQAPEDHNHRHDILVVVVRFRKEAGAEIEQQARNDPVLPVFRQIRRDAIDREHTRHEHKERVAVTEQHQCARAAFAIVEKQRGREEIVDRLAVVNIDVLACV